MKLCLNMIVKNEAHVIERAIASALPIISSWAIVDTGSEDGTQDIIHKMLDHLPGCLAQRDWKDFSTARNQALELACAFDDYALVLDADDVLDLADTRPGGRMWADPENADGYALEIDYGGTMYWRTAVVRPELFAWRGVVHEALYELKTGATLGRIHGVQIVCKGGGARSKDPKTYQRDAQLLRAELMRNPKDTRSAFYLAQSLQDAGDVAAAIKAYKARIELGGWAEEVYVSMLRLARLYERREYPDVQVFGAYLKAYEYRPTRAEAPYELARWLRLKGRYQLASDMAAIAWRMDRPDDVLFVDRPVYDWRAADELAVSSYYLGPIGKALCRHLCRQLLEGNMVPRGERARIERNLAFTE